MHCHAELNVTHTYVHTCSYVVYTQFGSHRASLLHLLLPLSLPQRPKIPPVFAQQVLDAFLIGQSGEREVGDVRLVDRPVQTSLLDM